MFTILFQLTLVALVLLSFVMIVGVPVAYATPQYWNLKDSSGLVLLPGLPCVSGWSLKLLVV